MSAPSSPDTTRFTEAWQLVKTAKSSTGGMVASQHYAASRVGAKVLADGGNAIDAAIATSLMIGTVEPWMSGLGGGGFMLYREQASDTVHSIDFGMKAPAALDAADYPLAAGQDDDLFGWPSVLENRNVVGPMSIAIPGYLAGINAALDKFATRSWADLITPAIDSARAGFAVDWYATLKIASVAPALSQFPTSASTYLPAGFVPAGEWGGPLPSISLGNLAATLERLRDKGADDFYHGKLAQDIVTDCQSLGSKLSADDLATYRATIAVADSCRYRDATVYSAPGLTAGPTLQDTLQRMESSDWQPGSGADAAAYLCYANALQAAYANRLQTLGDVDDTAAPGCTTHITVADKDGNMVALTQTLLSVFGSKVMLPQSGILMNNGIMWFDPRDNKPNSMAPDKRPLSNMCPTLFATDDGSHYALGASGGRRIMPAVMQLLSMVVDHDMPINTAIHQGRIDVSGSEQVCVDSDLDASVAQHLIDSNHKVTVVPNGVYPALYGCPNIIGRTADGTNTGAAYVASPWAEVALQDHGN